MSVKELKNQDKIYAAPPWQSQIECKDEGSKGEYGVRGFFFLTETEGECFYFTEEYLKYLGFEEIHPGVYTREPKSGMADFNVGSYIAGMMNQLNRGNSPISISPEQAASLVRIAADGGIKPIEFVIFNEADEFAELIVLLKILGVDTNADEIRRMMEEYPDYEKQQLIEDLQGDKPIEITVKGPNDESFTLAVGELPSYEINIDTVATIDNKFLIKILLGKSSENINNALIIIVILIAFFAGILKRWYDNQISPGNNQRSPRNKEGRTTKPGNNNRERETGVSGNELSSYDEKKLLETLQSSPEPDQPFDLKKQLGILDQIKNLKITKQGKFKAIPEENVETIVLNYLRKLDLQFSQLLSDSISEDDLKVILDILKSTEDINQISCFEKTITQISQFVKGFCTTPINLNTLPIDHLELLLSPNYRRLWDSEDRVAKSLKRAIFEQINQKNQNLDIEYIKGLLKKLSLIHEKAILFTVTLPNNNPIYYVTEPRRYNKGHQLFKIPESKEFPSLRDVLRLISLAVSSEKYFNSSRKWVVEMTNLKRYDPERGNLVKRVFEVLEDKNPEYHDKDKKSNYYVLVEIKLKPKIINFKVTKNINEIQNENQNENQLEG